MFINILLGQMLQNYLSGSYNFFLNIVPIPLDTSNPYFDLLTLVFCGAMLLLTINYAVNRKQFKSVLQALFIPRVRNQLLREGKIFDEWVYFFSILFIFLVQGALLYLIAYHFFVKLIGDFSPVVLYVISFGVVVTDYFLKMLIVKTLTYIFDCSAASAPFNLNKFFYLIFNSVVLLPLLMIAVYLRMPHFLFIYAAVFLCTYFMMLYRTLTINSNLVNPFHFFLYFCTLEILPYTIYAKLLITYANPTI